MIVLSKIKYKIIMLSITVVQTLNNEVKNIGNTSCCGEILSFIYEQFCSLK